MVVRPFDATLPQFKSHSHRTSCVTSSKSPNLSEAQFPPLQNGVDNNNCSYLEDCQGVK